MVEMVFQVFLVLKDLMVYQVQWDAMEPQVQWVKMVTLVYLVCPVLMDRPDYKVNQVIL